mgnify:CR=1 FL=1
MLTKQRHEEMVNIIRERGSITTNEMARYLASQNQRQDATLISLLTPAKL